LKKGRVSHFSRKADKFAQFPVQTLSFHTVINFLLSLSWASIGLYPSVGSKPLLIGLYLLAGVVMAWLILFLMGLLLGLCCDQTQQTSSAIGCAAQVYPDHPGQPKRGGQGLGRAWRLHP
jgi:hypothetical protein